MHLSAVFITMLKLDNAVEYHRMLLLAPGASKLKNSAICRLIDAQSFGRFAMPKYTSDCAGTLNIIK